MAVIMVKKLVYGVGINDADYTIQPSENGIQISCKFYQAWSDMLKRCYSGKYYARERYFGCYVSQEWLYFSNFKNWMLTQDWQGKQLDKDILVVGNKLYSPDTCVFVDAMTNTFTIDSLASRGCFPLGVCFDKSRDKFRSQCSNPFTKKIEHLGYFLNEDDAHLAWKNRKHKLACQLADLQSDKRVSEALRKRYA